MKISKYLIVFLAFWLQAHLEAQTMSDSLHSTKARALLVKSDLLNVLKLKNIPAVHSRRSCNCGCDIKKEAYTSKSSPHLLDAFDFCDSYVFEIKSNWYLYQSISKEIRSILTSHGFNFVNKNILHKSKHGIEYLNVEGEDTLTFYEEKKYKKGKWVIKISLSTPN